MVVNPDSAVLQLPDSMEEKLPVDGDHYTIVKFESNTSTTYTSVLEKLRQFEKDAPRVVSTRFGKQPHLRITQAFSRPGYEADTPAQSKQQVNHPSQYSFKETPGLRFGTTLLRDFAIIMKQQEVTAVKYPSLVMNLR